jgi:hypothetical protein
MCSMLIWGELAGSVNIKLPKTEIKTEPAFHLKSRNEERGKEFTAYKIIQVERVETIC